MDPYEDPRIKQVTLECLVKDDKGNITASINVVGTFETIVPVISEWWNQLFMGRIRKVTS